MRTLLYAAGFAVGCLAASAVGALAALSWMAEHVELADDGDSTFGEPWLSWGGGDE